MIDSQPNSWLKTALGQYLITQEQRIYDEHIADVFGFNALQIGMLEMDLLRQSRIPQLLKTSQHSGSVKCQSEYLPFAASSIDLICLPHVLEFSDNPHQTLREVERVLVPEGYLVLTGFNPMSSWGLRRKCSRKHDYPWCGKSLSLGRIKDWLALLGLEYMDGGMRGFVMPINDERWLKRQDFMDTSGTKYYPVMGGIYYVVAKKRVVNLTLLKPNWKKSLIKPHLVVSPHKSKPAKQHTKYD